MLANKLQQRSTVRAGARRAALKVCLSTQGMQLMPRLGGMGVLGRGWAAGSGRANCASCQRQFAGST